MALFALSVDHRRRTRRRRRRRVRPRPPRPAAERRPSDRALLPGGRTRNGIGSWKWGPPGSAAASVAAPFRSRASTRGARPPTVRGPGPRARRGTRAAPTRPPRRCPRFCGGSAARAELYASSARRGSSPFQWTADDVSAEANIPGATEPSPTLAGGNKRIKLLGELHRGRWPREGSDQRRDRARPAAAADSGVPLPPRQAPSRPTSNSRRLTPRRSLRRLSAVLQRIGPGGPGSPPAAGAGTPAGPRRPTSRRPVTSATAPWRKRHSPTLPAHAFARVSSVSPSRPCSLNSAYTPRDATPIGVVQSPRDRAPRLGDRSSGNPRQLPPCPPTAAGRSRCPRRVRAQVSSQPAHSHVSTRPPTSCPASGHPWPSPIRTSR